MNFKPVRPDERSTVLLLAVVFGVLVIWLTSYLIRAWKRGEISAPISRWPIHGKSSIRTFARTDAPVSFWFIYFIHFVFDAVFVAALLAVFYRLSL
jgi:hypothetical protein